MCAHRMNMLFLRFASAAPIVAVLCALLPAAAQDKPLPNIEALRTRALQQNQATEAQRERYLCRVRTETTQLDGKGGTRKLENDEREIFFVKNRQITQVIAKDGKPLTGGDAKKEIDHVKKMIADAESGKPNPNGVSQAEILRLIKLTNERRVQVNGRPTIVFDGVGDPNVKANGVIERAVEAMQGTISVDEATGHVQDTNVQGMHDVKMAGGLVANIHKGFLLHIISAPRTDGVWLVQEVWGSGDARVGLFMHPSYRFHQVTEGCRLFDVKSESVESLEEKH